MARLSIRACARLGGYLITEGEESSPDNPAVKKSLSAMLTPYLSRKLSNESPSEVRSMDRVTIVNIICLQQKMGAQWLSGRVLTRDRGAAG